MGLESWRVGCYDRFINQEGFTMIATKQVPTQEFLNNFTGSEVFLYSGCFTEIEDDGLCYQHYIGDYVDSENVWAELSENEYVIVVTDASCCVIGMTLSQVNDHNKEAAATKCCDVDGAFTSKVITKFWRDAV